MYRKVIAMTPNLPQFPGVPRWVSVFSIIALLVATSFAVLHLAGHGPGEHVHSHQPNAPDPARGP
jgi:hypothetical protein